MTSPEAKAAAHVTVLGLAMAGAAALYGLVAFARERYELVQGCLVFVVLMVACSSFAWFAAYARKSGELEPCPYWPKRRRG